MTDIPEDDLEGTRAALAPTLNATAAILPWVAKPRPPRFDPALNERWIAACKALADCWPARMTADIASLRPTLFQLYGIALETGDADCLRLGEALASAADLSEVASPSSRLIAALAATVECLNEPEGLENDAFASRAAHFAQRLESCMSLAGQSGERSAILDGLFCNEALERLDTMRDALLTLPPDAYGLICEAEWFAEQAGHLELFGVMHLAHKLVAEINRNPDLEDASVRARTESMLAELAAAIATIEA